MAVARPHLREDDVVEALAAAAEPLPPIGDAGFGACFDRFADARVVLIGEASHGTSEFYAARAAVTRRLVEHHGFSIVAVEADWPDAARIDRFVRARGSHGEAAFTRFPTWMWRNREVEDFVAWLRAHNAQLADDRRVEFRGLDLYSLRASIAEVLDYLDRADPKAAAAARARYGCLTPWQDDPAAYGRDALGGIARCENAVVAQLRSLLEARLQHGAAAGDALFDAEQNARVVQAAERYYRIMYHGARESWNLRDSHMFDTLSRVMRHRGPGARAVVWAHNSHIGDATATAMGWSGELNLGQLCRKRFGADAVLIGQGTDRGSVAAADDWDSPMRIKPVTPSLPGSWERAFLDAGAPRALTAWRGERPRALAAAVATTRLERAIGVIYRPQSERQSHYFEAVLGEQFDAWLWFEITSAVTPLGPEPATGAADTWPFGI
jgi:erythromycin esterase-like protein